MRTKNGATFLPRYVREKKRISGNFPPKNFSVSPAAVRNFLRLSHGVGWWCCRSDAKKGVSQSQSLGAFASKSHACVHTVVGLFL